MGWHLNKESQDSEIQLVSVYAKLFLCSSTCILALAHTYRVFRTLTLPPFGSRFVKNRKFASCFNFE